MGKKILIFHSGREDDLEEKKAKEIDKNNQQNKFDFQIEHHYLAECYEDFPALQNYLRKNGKNSPIQNECVEDDEGREFREQIDVIKKCIESRVDLFNPQIIVIHCGSVFRTMYGHLIPIFKDIKRIHKDVIITFEGISLSGISLIIDSSQLVSEIQKGIDEGCFCQDPKILEDVFRLFGHVHYYSDLEELSQLLQAVNQVMLFVQNNPELTVYLTLLEYCINYLEEKMYSMKNTLEQLGAFYVIHKFKNNSRYFQMSKNNSMSFESSYEFDTIIEENLEIMRIFDKRLSPLSDLNKDIMPKKNRNVIVMYSLHDKYLQPHSTSSIVSGGYVIFPLYAIDFINEASVFNSEVLFNSLIQQIKLKNAEIFILHSGIIVQKFRKTFTDAILKLLETRRVQIGIDSLTSLIDQDCDKKDHETLTAQVNRDENISELVHSLLGKRWI